VLLPPLQTESVDAVMEVAEADNVFTLMNLLSHLVVLQKPSARTKYVVLLPGETCRLSPVPASVPPQLLLYHFQEERYPSLPPFKRSVELLPEQTESKLARILVTASEVSRTCRVKLAQAVVFVGPSARTQ
jgi:hypothetical protein